MEDRGATTRPQTNPLRSEIIMSSAAKNSKTTVILCMRYSNAPMAIEWLCKAFGFEKHFVAAGEGDTIAHAELSFGNGMIMLGSIKIRVRPIDEAA
jgi:hypothetical protein